MQPTTGRNRPGFTLIELLVVLSIIALVAAILFPVFAKAREKARQVACLSNMKQIGLAILQYAQDYDENMPPCQINGGLFPNTWRLLTSSYAKSGKLYTCLSNRYNTEPTIYDNGVFFASYGANDSTLPDLVNGSASVSLSQIQNPTQLFLVGESDSVSWVMHNPPSDPLLNPGCATVALTPTATGCFLRALQSNTDLFAGHGGMGDWLFADGHVKTLKPTQTCRGADMWNRANSNVGLPCSAALSMALADNEQYWNQTNAP